MDGTDGDTYLNAVNALLASTPIVASGAVAGTPGVKGRTVQLKAKVDRRARSRTSCSLAVKGDRSAADRQDCAAHRFPAAAGPRRRRRRSCGSMGEFDLSAARFTDPGGAREARCDERRARAGTRTTPQDVLSDLKGASSSAGGVPVAHGRSSFQIPGAAVQLAGTYGLRSEALEFDGTLRMQATISEAAGGGSEIGVPQDCRPVLQKEGAPARCFRFSVRGTREEPKFGLDVVKALTPK